MLWLQQGLGKGMLWKTATSCHYEDTTAKCEAVTDLRNDSKDAATDPTTA